MAVEADPLRGTREGVDNGLNLLLYFFLPIN
jgi:hypothetical protein